MNINAVFSSLITIILRHKWALLPAVILVSIIVLIIVNQQPQSTPQSPPFSSPTITQSPPSFPTSTTDNPTNSPPPTTQSQPDDLAIDGVDYSKDPQLEQKEELANGMTKYIMKSNNPDRPEIILTRGNQDVFNRTVLDTKTPQSLSEYTNLFGQPEKIMQGSRYYGPDAKWYIYPEEGMAFVTKNGLVLEIHTFYTMTTDDYIQNYGEDIQSQ